MRELLRAGKFAIVGVANTLVDLGIFTLLAQVLAALAQPHTQSAVLGFTPRDSEGGVPGPAGGDDDALFILTGGENLFSAHRAMFPLLTHA